MSRVFQISLPGAHGDEDGMLLCFWEGSQIVSDFVGKSQEVRQQPFTRGLHLRPKSCVRGRPVHVRRHTYYYSLQRKSSLKPTRCGHVAGQVHLIHFFLSLPCTLPQEGVGLINGLDHYFRVARRKLCGSRVLLFLMTSPATPRAFYHSR